MHNFTGLVILRAFMGAFEAACQPTFVLLSSTWYQREEQATIVSLWYDRSFTPLSCPYSETQVYDERPSEHNRRPTSIRLLLRPLHLPNQIMASSLHVLRYLNRNLGRLHPLVDARLPHARKMLQRK